jgi:hypothetical protein
VVKDEALFLADELEAPLGTVISSEVDRRAAAELRRLHAANLDCVAWFDAVKAERDELLGALVSFTKSDYIKKQHPKRYAAAVAAITKAEGEKT